MDYTITLTERAQFIALTRARGAYARSNGQITEHEFLQLMINQRLDSLLVKRVKRSEFLERFTHQERETLRESAKSAPQVHDYLELLQADEMVDLTHPTTTAAVQAFEAAGLIAQGRATQILAL